MVNIEEKLNIIIKMNSINNIINENNEKKLLKILTKSKNRILIEGMPGVGNIGKQVIDFIVKDKKSLILVDIYSNYFPHFVKINPEIELPKHELFYFQHNNDIFFLYTGITQSLEDYGTYELAQNLHDLINKYNINKVITIAGIGLNQVSENPKIYLKSESKSISKLKRKGISLKPDNVVDVIFGLSGVLLGLIKINNTNNAELISILIETFSDPNYSSIKETKKLLLYLNDIFNLDFNFKDIDNEIKKIKIEEQKLINTLTTSEHSSKEQKALLSSYIG